MEGRGSTGTATILMTLLWGVLASWTSAGIGQAFTRHLCIDTCCSHSVGSHVRGCGLTVTYLTSSLHRSSQIVQESVR